MEYNNTSTLEFRSNIYPADRDQELIDKEFRHNYPNRCAISSLKGYHPIGQVYQPEVLPNGQKKNYKKAIKCTDTNCDRFEECKKYWINYTDEEFEMLSNEGAIVESNTPEIIDVVAGRDVEVEDYSWTANVDLVEWYWGKLTEDQLASVFDVGNIKIQGFRNVKSCFANPIGRTRAKKALLDYLKKAPIPSRDGFEKCKELENKAELNSILFVCFYNKVNLDIIDHEIVDLSELKPKPITIESLQEQIKLLEEKMEKLQQQLTDKDEIIKSKDKEIKQGEATFANLQKNFEAKKNEHAKEIQALERNLQAKDAKIISLEEEKNVNDLLNGLGRRILLFNLKPSEQCSVKFEYACITYASVSNNELPAGEFTEMWYLNDAEDDLKFWSMIEKLKKAYDTFGLVALSETEITGLGLKE